MLQFGKPTVILKTAKKLHISKTPGILSWAALIASGYVGDIIASLFLKDQEIVYRFLTAGFCVIFALWKLETWEDLVVDREACLITFLKRRWYHCLWMEVPLRNVARFPTASVTCVLVSDKRGIDIVKSDGSATVIAKDCNDIKRLRDIRKEISTFLHLEMTEELPRDYFWNEDYLWSAEAAQEVVDEVPAIQSESDTETLDTSFDNQSKT